MSTQKYQAFLRAVEKGSLSKAAEELGYTQSGISHMMKSLEEEVGFPLLVRTASGIRPNAEGELLLPAIRELLGSRENLEQQISRIRGSESGHIRIAAFFSVAIQWLPHVLREFQQDYPNVEVQLIEAGAAEIENLVVNREAELCIYSGREKNRSFDWYPLYRDPMLALVPPEHPLAKLERIPAEALRGENFIMPKAGFDVDIHKVLEEMHCMPNFTLSSSSDYTIIAMVEAGLGVTVMSKLILDGTSTRAVARPMDPEYHRTLGIGVPSDRTISPAARRFMEYIQRYVSRLPGGIKMAE